MRQRMAADFFHFLRKGPRHAAFRGPGALEVLKVEAGNERLTFLIGTLMERVKPLRSGFAHQFKEQALLLVAVDLPAEAASQRLRELGARVVGEEGVFADEAGK